MTKQELMKQIDDLRSRLFFLAMKDNWSSDDLATRRQWAAELIKLENQLKEIEAQTKEQKKGKNK